MPAPATALVADAHLGGPGGPAAALIAQLADLPGRAGRLVLLGDIFHLWVGHERYETAEIAAFAPCLATLRAAGVAVDYVEGNRDFFLPGVRYAPLFDRVAREVAFEAAGRRCLAVHGDGLSADDRLYRFWRWLSKSPPARAAFLHLPGPVARRLAHSAERALARTNFRHRLRIPEEAILEYGARRLAEGHDLLLLGHFHEERRWCLPQGEIWLLEAWFRSRRVEWLGGGGG